MAAKTIVITLPKHQVIANSPTTAMASKQLSSLLANNFIQLIKEEPEMMEDEKQPRKRQRLDHLSMEEKIQRRKLKNRVAAQTARDRKKARMDELEAQIADLTSHVAQLTSLTSVLSEKNKVLSEENDELTEKNGVLAEQNAELRVKVEGCRCGVRADGVMVPVGAPTDGSAVSEPQQKAVGALAALRIMVLSTLISHWSATAAVTALLAGPQPITQCSAQQQSEQHHSAQQQLSKSEQIGKSSLKWWGAQQHSWNPAMI